MAMTEGWGEAGCVLLVALVICAGIPVVAGQDAVVVTTNPVDATGWYTTGNAYVNEGRYDGALHAYDQAIALDPGYARAYFAKGQVLAMTGMHAEAVKAYDQAIALDPGLDPVVESYLQASEKIVYPEILSGSLITGYWVAGFQYLVIDNSQGTGDVVVAIAPTGINVATTAVYVKKGYINSFDGVVPPGEFTFFITSGERWNPAENRFDRNANYLRWAPTQYTYGATGYGYTLVFLEKQIYPNWYLYNLQPVPETAFPAL
jgi:tetratricopeptide (TPR) repeat protein